LNEEDFAIFLEDFSDFLDALEASVAKMKQQIAKLIGAAELEGEAKHGWTWNPDKIKWKKAEGARGEFEKSEDFSNPEFKAMLKDLAGHGGRLTGKAGFTGHTKTAARLEGKGGP